MKEMVYSPVREKVKLLIKDFYKGYLFAVLSYGTHPCAYVAISGGQPYYDVEFYENVRLPMHGGCTFAGWGLGKFFDSSYKVLGWDYGHFGDFVGYYPAESSLFIGKRWTTKEMVEDCKNVIEQLYILEHPGVLYK